jgi:hypothetical protein
MKEFGGLQKDGVSEQLGISAALVDEDNLYEWEVRYFGFNKDVRACQY